jgi:mono/diheme cytochrome c family protein
MRPWCLALGIVGAVVVALALALAALLVRGGTSARAEPSALETAVARTLRAWAIPSSARDRTNPVPASPEVLAAGLAHFADHCASCHGNDGSGDTELGRGLSPRPPDLRRAPTQRLSDGELFHVIENGVRLTGMPAWGRDGHEEASWQLVRFIRHLPELTADERRRMEALNPRAPHEEAAPGAAADDADGGHDHDHRSDAH